jgi:hypothetical protein
VLVLSMMTMVTTMTMAGLYSWGTSFKSQLDYQLSWGFLWLSSVFPQKCWDNKLKYGITISFKIITCSRFIIIFPSNSKLCNFHIWKYYHVIWDPNTSYTTERYE